MSQVRRRQFLIASGVSLAAPLARAQPAGKVYRVGYLSLNPLQAASHLFEALKAGLRELGYVESRNLQIEHRHAEGKVARLEVR